MYWPHVAVVHLWGTASELRYLLHYNLTRGSAKQDELKRTARELQCLKLRRAALDPPAAGQAAPPPPPLAAHTHTDYSTTSFCRSIAVDIVRAALKRIDNRPGYESVHKCVLSVFIPPSPQRRELAMDLTNISY